MPFALHDAAISLMAKWVAQFGPTGDDDRALLARDEAPRRVLHVCSSGPAVRVSV